MNFLYQLLGTPLGYIVWALYQVFSNYGVSIIIFTIILRAALVPLGIKQQKSSAKMAAYQPMINEINKKYAKNPSKKNEELQKLYTEEGYSPMSGCLPMLLQFLVLFGIIDVVYRPLTHMLHLGSDMIDKAIEIFGGQNGMMSQLLMVQDLQADPSKYSQLGEGFVNSVNGLNMHFLGLNLGDKPEFAAITILIPIIAGIFSFAQVFVSTKMNPTAMATPDGGSAPGTKGMKIFMYIMPLFSLWITFSVPIGVGIYWITTYVFSLIQVIVLNKIYNPVELKEQAIKELEEKRKKKKKKVVKKTIKRDRDGKVIESEEIKTQKEIDRQRLAEARKRDAEKYGEDYIEVTDNDLKG